jgi:MFS family permease
MFLAYFFPLFAEGLGVSPSNTGCAFLLNGLCIIYLGPLLNRFVLKFPGHKKSIVLAGIIAASSLLIFASHRTLTTAYIVVALMGIAESFGITAQIDYFTELKASRELGEGKSMGYYSLVENLGQVLGPIVFGELLVLGIGNGLRTLGILIVCTLMIFYVLTFQRKKAVKDSVAVK